MTGVMWTLIGTFVGGVGLFLLGMQLMTDGLKRAQGQAMRRVLATWTHTRLRALLAGAFVTAVVQASGAVIVAALGFVNAGLLPLLGGLWIVFGASLGTTATGWLVALLGFDFDIKALALPFIGLGVALQLLAQKGKLGGLGQALAGFGLFFIGIGTLQGGFAGLADQVNLHALASHGGWTTVVFIGVGLGLTVMMQSSSASLAIVITATAGGVLPFHAATAAAIGANVGTTSTAIFAVIGASANARRLVTGQVIFKLLTATVVLLVLPWMTELSLTLAGGNLATGLALFHTLFNVLGVLLMWPLATPMARRLDTLFVGQGVPDEARPRYIEVSMLSEPASAIEALTRELARLAEIARRMVAAVLSAEHPNGTLTRDRLIVAALSDSLGDFVTALQERPLTPRESAALPHALQAVTYYNTAADLAIELSEALQADQVDTDPVTEAAVAWFKGALLARLDDQIVSDRAKALRADVNADYQALKSRLLHQGTRPELSTHALVTRLEQMSLLRRAMRQLIKGHKQLRQLGYRAATHVDLKRTQPLPTLPP